MSEGKKKLTAEELEALWQQAGLSNDLMFRFVMENPILCQRTVSLLLGKQIGRITEQQTQFSIETDGRLKGIRLDLFVEVDGEMVDVEIQTVYLSKKEMGHRLRFYQSELDQMGIRKGQKYKDLKRSIIIFICTYDPFGKGIGRYTFEEVCQEYTDIILDDGITKIIYHNVAEDSHLYRWGMMTSKNTVGTTGIHAHGECVSPFCYGRRRFSLKWESPSPNAISVRRE